MKKIMSVIVALFISVLSFSAFSVNAESELEPDVLENDSIGVYWTYTDLMSSYISISGNNVTCISDVTGKTGVTKIVVTQTLQKYSANGWYDYKSPKSKTVNSSSAYFVNTYSNVIIGTYRTKTVAKVYKNSNYETVGPAYSSSKRVS